MSRAEKGQASGGALSARVQIEREVELRRSRLKFRVVVAGSSE